jgi:hypothetical protein
LSPINKLSPIKKFWECFTDRNPFSKGFLAAGGKNVIAMVVLKIGHFILLTLAYKLLKKSVKPESLKEVYMKKALINCMFRGSTFAEEGPQGRDSTFSLPGLLTFFKNSLNIIP